MRIVVDLQGAQTESRFRGIGRYSLSFAQALARKAQNHELWIALNTRFENTIEPLRAAFDGLAPQDRIVLFDIPVPVKEVIPANAWRARAAEYVREYLLATLRPDITYTTSLFEGFIDDAATSVGLLDSAGLSAVTVYDLIPLVAGKDHLSNENMRKWYFRKLDSLKRADVLLAISEASRREAIESLHIPEEKVFNISGAAEKCFHPFEPTPEDIHRMRGTFGLGRPFVMYSGGFDPHKNLDSLIKAFSLLPTNLKTRYQLIITGKYPRGGPHNLLLLAGKAGLPKEAFIFTGHVDDNDLVALYNLCDLFVCPSLHEGFGLPALEAMSCGAPVIGSNATSIPEVIGRADALFDPTKPNSIAQKMAQVLTNPDFAQSLREHGLRQAKKFSWEESAHRALAAFEERYAQRKSIIPSSSGVHRSRPRLAYVSPFPPQRTGIADYSAELLPYLSRHYDIELVADQEEVSDPWVCANVPVRSPEWFSANAERYQRILYHVGNSPFHRYQFDLLESHPGTIVMHDFFLSSVLQYLEEAGKVPHVFRRALYASHGYVALAEAQKSSENAKYTFPANKRVLDQAAGVIVHSDLSKRWAADWYGAQYSEDWRIIPALRALPPLPDRSAARAELSIGSNDLLVCSFGFTDVTKLCHRLLDAWLMSRLAQDSRCYLVFVGAKHGGEYGAKLDETIKRSGLAGDRIRITGWVSEDLYRTYLSAADIAVQLRALSRGETSRTVLDCLAHGAPTIINANGTAAELADSVLIKLSDEFNDAELTAAMERLWRDKTYRAKLSAKAVDHIRTVHAPARVAEMYREAIEHFAETSLPSRERNCLAQIAQCTESRNPSERDLLQIAAALASNRKQKGLSQFIVDVSSIMRTDLKSGIERVVRSVLFELLMNPPQGFRVEPVYFYGSQYRYARRFTLRFLGLDDEWAEDEVLEAGNGDVFLGLDWAADVVPIAEPTLRRMRHRGVRIAFVVHDLLPVLRPQDFPPGIDSMLSAWLSTLARVSDGIICVSASTANDLSCWLDQNPPLRHRPLAIGVSHNGADIAASVPSAGLPADGERVLLQCRERPSFLMVGTIEPRKGHAQALAAFDRLWAQGVQVNLVIVGKQGWMVESLVERLRSHPESAERLFLLEWVSDEMLLRLYEECTALLMASEGEGFGLPLIEAVQHGLPIIARDLPVFKEVAGEHAYYFHGSEPDDLATAIREWMELQRSGKAPDSSGMPWFTWKQSTARLLEVVLGGGWRSLWAPHVRN